VTLTMMEGVSAAAVRPKDVAVLPTLRATLAEVEKTRGG